MEHQLSTDIVYKKFINYLNFNNLNNDNIIKGNYNYKSLSDYLTSEGYKNIDNIIEYCNNRYCSLDFYHRNILNPNIMNLNKVTDRRPSELLLFGGVIKMDILDYSKIEMNIFPNNDIKWNDVIITFSDKLYKDIIKKLNTLEHLKIIKILNSSEEIVLNVKEYEFISDTEMKVKLLYATAII